MKGEILTPSRASKTPKYTLMHSVEHQVVPIIYDCKSKSFKRSTNLYGTIIYTHPTEEIHSKHQSSSNAESEMLFDDGEKLSACLEHAHNFSYKSWACLNLEDMQNLRV